MGRFKKMLGVTLLEVMLVLAIIAMIIVLSIRYYQGASTTQQATSAVGIAQAVVAAANNIGGASGNYSTVDTTSVTSLLSAGGVSMPWGGTVGVVGTAAGVLTMTFPSTPVAVCTIVKGQFSGNTKFAVTCPAGPAAGDMVITYTR
jgi:type II secretory pathway pseudopilin PulG